VYATHRIKAAGATLTVGFLLATAFTATALAGNGLTQQQNRAVRARADAMNRYYHLGAYSPSALSVQQALRRRSEAMDRVYHLGAFASTAPAVQRADLRRSEAIDRFYRTGSYAVISSSNGFDWADAGIGAGAMFGLILLAGGVAVAATRGRPVREPSSARTT
jgi:hypothetical protein